MGGNCDKPAVSVPPRMAGRPPPNCLGQPEINQIFFTWLKKKQIYFQVNSDEVWHSWVEEMEMRKRGVDYNVIIPSSAPSGTVFSLHG